MSFSHRGEAKRYLNDRQGAKEDFQKAFELDPDYAFAGLRLLDEQIESDELDAAMTTLVRLQEHIGGPYVAYGAIQLAVKQKDESAALEAFRDLATEDEATFTLLHKSLELIVGAGWQSQLDIALQDLMEDSDAHTMVGRLWVEREMTKDDRAFVEKLPKMIESGPLGHEALVTYIDLLGTPSRGSRLPGVIQQFNETLRKSNRGWAKVGGSLVMARQYSLAVAWLADWKDRKELEPWMLHPLTRGLFAMGRFDEAYSVSQSAAKMHPDATSADHEVWLALEDALAGRTEQAGEHLDGVDDYKLDDVFGLLYTFAESLVMVQEAEPGSKQRIFKDACEDIVSKLGVVKPTDLDDGFAVLYQRVVKRLACDAGGVRAWWWGMKQRMFPTKPGGK